MNHKLSLAVLAICLTGGVQAQTPDAAIRKALEGVFRGGEIKSVTPSPLPGLFEVQVVGASGESELYYVDAKGEYMVAGELYNLASKTNLTQERLAKINAISFSDLPIDLAVVQKFGNGTRKLATFEDPNCGYCKKLARDLQTMKDVTVYTFIMPVLGDDSQKKSEAIWCAKDRNKAWTDWMVNNVAPPEASAKCDLTGLRKSIELGRKYRIQGTPTMFLGNGERMGGYVPAAQLEQRMAKAR